MPNDPCPERDQISAYMLGKLTEEEEEKLTEHFGQCQRCQAIADEVENATDDLVAIIREPVPVGGYLGEPQLQRAMGRVEAVAFGGIGSVGQAASSLSDETSDLEHVGQYEVLQRVARGGMGTVYKARHTKLDRLVALKVLSEDRIRDTNALERFDREMKAIGKLDHPNIVRAVDAGESDDVHYLAMDFIDGYDLSKVVKHLDNVPVADACEIVRQAAIGLQYVHENGLIHRDVKPSNLMIDSTGRVRLLDLGLALLWEEQAEDTHLTATGTLMGTYDYMSPEQCGDSHNVDIRSDLYGLGCTLYELLCGTPPFSGPEMDSRGKKIAAHLQTPVPPIRDRCPEVPEALVEVLDRLLAKDPADRFSTPAALAAALEPLTTDSDLPGLLESMESQPEALVDTAESHTNTVEHASSHAVSTDSGKEPAATLPAPLPPRRRWGWIAVAAGLGGCVLLGVILTLTNRHGTLTIETDDPNVQVAVKQAGELVEVLDAESGWTIRLDSGKYDIEMKGGQDRFKLDNDTVTVTRGDEVRVKVTLKRPRTSGTTSESKEEFTMDLGGDVKIEFVLVPAGEFMMGCNDREAPASEKPVHKVKISNAFYIGKYPISVRQFKRFVDMTKYETECEAKTHGYSGWGLVDGEWQKTVGNISWRNPGFDQTPDHPVVLVSWNDAWEFCKWATKLTDQSVRLSREAEWEYAARGSNNARYPWGEKWVGTSANHADQTRLNNDRIMVFEAPDKALSSGYIAPPGGTFEDDGYAYTSPVAGYEKGVTGVPLCADLKGKLFQ